MGTLPQHLLLSLTSTLFPSPSLLCRSVSRRREGEDQACPDVAIRASPDQRIGSEVELIS